MPENWSVKSNYSSKCVTGAQGEAKVVCGFDLEMLKKLFTGAISSLQKKLGHGEDVHPHLVCPKD